MHVWGAFVVKICALSRFVHPAVMCSKGRMLSPHGKVHGKATESTVEILYRLGTHQDDGLRTRYDITEWRCVSTHTHSVTFCLIAPYISTLITCLLMSIFILVVVTCSVVNNNNNNNNTNNNVICIRRILVLQWCRNAVGTSLGLPSDVGFQLLCYSCSPYYTCLVIPVTDYRFVTQQWLLSPIPVTCHTSLKVISGIVFVTLASCAES